MKLLSEIIARAYCPAAVPLTPDRLFSVGCLVVGSEWRAADAADAGKVGAQARAITAGPRPPWEPDQEIDGVFNDLFSPYRDYSDGRLTIWVPVPVEEPLWSSLIQRDWRFIALAWWAARRMDADPKQQATIMAFDTSGRTVGANIRIEELYSAMDGAIDLEPHPYQTPGAACSSCSKAAGCEGLARFVDNFGPMSSPQKGESDGIRSLRLYNERAAVGMKLERLEALKASIDEELGKSIKDGKIKLGPDELLEIPSRTTVAWDFATVRGVLMSHGIWDDSFGSIRSGELQKSLEIFPEVVRKDLLKARTEKISQPSLSEAIRHGRYATRPAIFGAVTLVQKGRLGKG